MAKRESPHTFSKNVLTKEQLNEILDMREVKKMIMAKKRGSTQIEHEKSRRDQKLRLDYIKDMLSTGSGLVLQSNSVKRKIFEPLTA